MDPGWRKVRRLVAVCPTNTSDSKAEGFVGFSRNLLLWNQACWSARFPLDLESEELEKRRGRLQDDRPLSPIYEVTVEMLFPYSAGLKIKDLFSPPLLPVQFFITSLCLFLVCLQQDNTSPYPYMEKRSREIRE